MTALVLAAAGLYGLLAYLVTQRTGEIGIRIALGAKRTQLLHLVPLDGLRPEVVGMLIGLPASAAVVRLIRSMLYETQPLDLGEFADVTGVFCSTPLQPASSQPGTLLVLIRCKHCETNSQNSRRSQKEFSIDALSPERVSNSTSAWNQESACRQFCNRSVTHLF